MNMRIFGILILLVLLVANPVFAEGNACVYVFGSPGCPHCANVKDFIESGNFNNSEIHYFTVEDNASLFVDVMENYNVPGEDWTAIPKIFAGERYCIGDRTCISQFESMLAEAEGMQCPDRIKLAFGNDTHKDNGTLTLGGVTLLALVDAVNPCALAVLIILLSAILLRDPKKKLKALFSGISFSASVFIVYFLLGVLIVLGLKWVSGVSSLSTEWLYRVFGVFAIIMGILNIKDYFKYGAGGFVMEVPQKWRPLMKSFIKSVTSARGAFIVGIIVSLFLLPCTSGPYFVAGGLLSGVSWNSAIPWLFYYNLIFVSPMVIISFLVYGGFTAVDEVSGWKERNIKRLHLFAGSILLVLGILMVFGII